MKSMTSLADDYEQAIRPAVGPLKPLVDGRRPANMRRILVVNVLSQTNTSTTAVGDSRSDASVTAPDTTVGAWLQSPGKPAADVVRQVRRQADRLKQAGTGQLLAVRRQQRPSMPNRGTSSSTPSTHDSCTQFTRRYELGRPVT